MTNQITFKQICESDLPQMRQWIKTNPDVKKWYYYNKVPRISSLYKKTIERLKIEKFKANIIFIDKKPVGYIQSYAVEGWKTWTKRVKLFEKTASLDYFIGDLNYIHKGFGSKIVLEYIEKHVKNDGYDYVMISPDPSNVVNIKCVEKSGFEYVKTVSIPYQTSKHKEAIYIKKLMTKS